ncbi:hypothetical protein KR044_005348 [Drosophila immigrans]|nr:hypothetical protein KR044_005348 [Drosophila immigrans]
MNSSYRRYRVYKRARQKFACQTYSLLCVWLLMGIIQWVIVCCVDPIRDFFRDYYGICIGTFVIAIILFLLFVHLENVRFMEGINLGITTAIVELQIISLFALVAHVHWPDLLFFFVVCVLVLFIFIFISSVLPRRIDLTLDVAELFIFAFFCMLLACFFLMLLFLIHDGSRGFLSFEIPVTIMILMFVMYHAQTINGSRFAEMRLNDYLLASIILFHDFLIIYWLTFYIQYHNKPMTPDHLIRTTTTEATSDQTGAATTNTMSMTEATSDQTGVATTNTTHMTDTTSTTDAAAPGFTDAGSTTTSDGTDEDTSDSDAATTEDSSSTTATDEEATTDEDEETSLDTTTDTETDYEDSFETEELITDDLDATTITATATATTITDDGLEDETETMETDVATTGNTSLTAPTTITDDPDATTANATRITEDEYEDETETTATDVATTGNTEAVPATTTSEDEYEDETKAPATDVATTGNTEAVPATTPSEDEFEDETKATETTSNTEAKTTATDNPLSTTFSLDMDDRF